jgi:hypothetical protein
MKNDAGFSIAVTVIFDLPVTQGSRLTVTQESTGIAF